MQTIFDQSLDVICTIDEEGRFASVSPRVESLWGHRAQDMAGRPFSDFLHPDDLEASRAEAERIRGGRPAKAYSNRFLHKDGGAIPMMWSAVWSPAHRMIFAIGRDMREHEAAEAKLRQAQKLEAVGRLTGGVAHDFNNLLTVVIGSSELLAEALADRPDLQPLAQLILDSAENGAALVSRLLAFSRQQSLVSQTMDSGRLLRTLLPILERTFAADIQIAVEADDGVRWSADPTQLVAAMLNLCLNARDAMHGGGRLTLGVRRAPGKDRLVALSVTDTGEGMSPETIQRVMEPFFTTKPVGKGSGLGLSMAYGFAQQSGGRLAIESEPGRGTRVTLCLPESDDEVTLPAAAPPISAAARGRRILLVEDDLVVREQLTKQLIDLGHRVTAFATGPEALQWLTESGGVDLLMTDIVMPGGMNGRQLANYARALVPDVPILFTSGHSDDAQLSAARLLPRAGFLPKPYRRAELARALAEALVDV
jgi:PAS domain S-box-containing protein